MISRKALTRILIPGAVAVVESTNLEKPTDNTKICRPSELPLYCSDPEVQIAKGSVGQPSSPSILERTICDVRRYIFTITEEVKAYKKVAKDHVDSGFATANGWMDYLAREESGHGVKAGAIVLGGLTGYILGLRRKRFGRTLYTTIGALGMASICYPNEAKEYFELTNAEIKKCAIISYHFIYGAKKGDPPLELPTLKVPSSLSEVWEMVPSFGKSTSSSVADTVTEQQVESVLLEGGEVIRSNGKHVIDGLDLSTSISPECIPDTSEHPKFSPERS